MNMCKENLIEIIHSSSIFIYPIGVKLGLWEGNCFFASSKVLDLEKIEKVETTLCDKNLMIQTDFDKIVLLLNSIYECKFPFGCFKQNNNGIEIIFVPENNCFPNKNNDIVNIFSINLQYDPYVMVIFDRKSCQIRNLYSFLYRSKRNIYSSLSNNDSKSIKNCISEYHLMPILDYFGIEMNYLSNFKNGIEDIVSDNLISGYHIIFFHNSSNGKCFNRGSIKRILIAVNTSYNEVHEIAIVEKK
ncbi:MAG: hypothetical protein ACP5KS_09920 [Candidatus Hydrogenedens sp.]